MQSVKEQNILKWFTSKLRKNTGNDLLGDLTLLTLYSTNPSRRLPTITIKESYLENVLWFLFTYDLVHLHCYLYNILFHWDKINYKSLFIDNNLLFPKLHYLQAQPPNYYGMVSTKCSVLHNLKWRIHSQLCTKIQSCPSLVSHVGSRNKREGN